MGLAGNADPASPWISPMGRMGRGFLSLASVMLGYASAVLLRLWHTLADMG